MKHYIDQVITAAGLPLVGATVKVTVANATPGSGASALLFSDDAITPASNPVTTDTTGTFDFYVVDGRYDLTVTGANFLTKIVADVEIFDAIQANSGDSPVVLNAKTLNTIRFADQFAGADAVAKIQAAHSDLPAGGGTIDARGFTGAITGTTTLTLSKTCKLLLGVCTLTSPASPMINITAGGVAIEGVSEFATVLQTSSGTADIIQVNSSFSDIKNLGFKSSVARTAGAAINYLSNFSNAQNLRIDNTFNGIQVSTANSGGTFRGVSMGSGLKNAGNWNCGISLGKIASGTVPNSIFEGCTISGEEAFADALVSLYDGCDSCTFTDCLFNAINVASVALKFDAVVAGSVPQGSVFENCEFEGLTSDGVLVNGARSTHFRNCTISTSNRGLNIAATGTVKFLEWNGGAILNNKREGILLSGGTGIVVRNVWLGDNGQNTNNTFADINVAAGVSNFQLLNNYFGTLLATGAPANKVSNNINIAVGASNNYVLAYNDMSLSNSVGAVLVNGATGASGQLFGNLPITPGTTSSNHPNNFSVGFTPAQAAFAIQGDLGCARSATTGELWFGTDLQLGLLRESQHVLRVQGTPGSGTQGNLKIDNLITGYNGIATVSNGVPSELATVHLTTQAAAIGTTTLYAVPTSGMYRISIYQKVTQAATVSSTMGAVTIAWTDPDDSTAQTITTAGPNAGNTTTTSSFSNFTFTAKAGTNITYADAYATNGATSMQYALSIRLEAI